LRGRIIVAAGLVARHLPVNPHTADRLQPEFGAERPDLGRRRGFLTGRLLASSASAPTFSRNF
jgi:hypothetical protein